MSMEHVKSFLNGFENAEKAKLLEELTTALSDQGQVLCVTPEKVIPPLRVKKLFDDAIIPTKSHETDSGFDLYAYKVEKLYENNEAVSLESYASPSISKEIYLLPGQRCLINTGISATVGPGFEIQIRPRSGNALKKGITVLNTPGTIDEGYRGMIGVILQNASDSQVTINMGDRIAQMVVCPVVLSKIQVVEDLDVTERNDGGFGHTGN